MDKVTPKYVLVEEKIKQAIKRKEIIDKLPGERSLAKQYGFSYMTIRKAVDNLVAEGLLYRIPMKGTFVVDSRARKTKTKTKIIGYFLDSSIAAGLTSPYYSLIFNALQKQASKRGYSLIYLTDVDESSSVSFFNRIDGLIMSCFPRIEHIVHQVNQHIPVVVIDNSSSDKTIPSIIIDNFNAISSAVNYLCSLGHKRIGFITGLEDSDVGKNRHAGYVHGLAVNGLKHKEELVFKGNFSFKSGLAGANYFLSLTKPPTAIICANDSMAIAAIRKISNSGLRVPDDISIIGFDDIAVASQIAPSLTTLAAPIDEMTELACSTLISLIDNKKPESKHIALPARLVIRETCKDINKTIAAHA
jgi:DNA-binding LacI/PurR family transcriptional regulator